MDFKFQINSIDGGMAPSYHLMNDNQYLAAIGYDPEAPLGTNTINQPSMALVPTVSQKFSGGKLSAAPMWLMNNNKDTNVYAFTSNSGTLMSYDQSYTETAIYTFGVASGNGGAYYNNYIYMASASDINRYGPLDNSPYISASGISAWTGTALGSHGALTNASYPGIRGMTYPNHPMHVHNDGKLYVGDTNNLVSAVSSAQGVIHFIKTKKGTSEGDTDWGSTAVATKLPIGFLPMAMCSFGTDLAILASQTQNYAAGANFKGGNSALFLWDTISPLPYQQIDIPDPLATAIKNVNGQLRIWSGMIDSYVRITGYTGGNSLIPIDYINDGSPPPAGAVDAMGNMVAWGVYGVYPQTYAGVMSKGYRSPMFDPTARHLINRYTGSGSLPIITAINFQDKSQTGFKYPFTAWMDSGGQGIDRNGRLGATANNNVFRSKLYNIGQEFEITRVRIPLVNPVNSNTNIVVKLYVDNDGSQTTLATINNTNYPGQQFITIKPTVAKGNVNFFLEFTDTSTATFPIAWPITINGRTLKDNE